MARLPQFPANCTIEVEGRPVAARAGESVASALLAAGKPLLARSPKYHRPRGPFCLSGSCGSCLMRIDGLPNQLACRIPCRDGLAARQQNAFPSAEHDVFGAVDWLFPSGLDHHTLMVQSTVANRAAIGVARQLAGLGRLPDRPVSPAPAASEEAFDAVVIGGGPAGLAAAEALASACRKVALIDSGRRLGGRLRCHYRLPGDPSLDWADVVKAAVAHAGGEVLTGATALGVWRNGGAPLVAAVSPPHPAQANGSGPATARLRLLRAPRLVLAAGGHVQPPLFEGNDVPGIFSGRGLAVALAEDGVVPGRRCAIAGSGAEAEALARVLAAAGVEAMPLAAEPERVLGRARLRGVVARGSDGRVVAATPRSAEASASRGDPVRIRCDTLAITSPPAPACELARQAGAAIVFDPALGAFKVPADDEGQTGVPGLFAAGEMTGIQGAAEAAERGQAAGKAAAR
jgi:sarcosine oxidase subunit alpha